MSRPTNDERLDKIHEEALLRFDRIQDAVRDERKQCLDDRRFYSIPGAQWEGDLGAQFENKPKIEVNKVHLAVMRVINEYRNNRITVDFVPRSGVKDDKLADACDGMFRADEIDSGAEEAYDNAFEEGAGGGFGAFRLRAAYEDEEDPDDDRQRIKIEPIYDADTSVYFDPDAKRQDKADAKYAFVVYSQSHDAFRGEWDEDPATWPKEVHRIEFDWCTPDIVYVAEYYIIEEKRDYALTYTGVAGDEKKLKASELDDDTLDQLIATGYTETRRKRTTSKRVHKYIMSGNSILEDSGVLAGKYIPVVPVYGKRWFVDNVERCMGVVRLAKDAQRLKNAQLSKLAEISATSSVRKPIFTPEQVKGHELTWAEDNIKNYPYALVNPITDANGNPQPAAALGYTEPPEISPALAALLQLTETDMRDILGNQGEADKMVSNISGKAVEMIQTRLDMQTFIYMSNFAKAIRRAGEIWLSMAKDVYVEEGREMKTIGQTQEVSTVVLGDPEAAPKTGAVRKGIDFSRAAFDVAVDVGPSFASRREATVRAITGIMQMTQDPETLQVLTATALMNMEGEGLNDLREYNRKKLVQMGVLKPTAEEAQMMAAQSGQKSANDKALEGMAEEAQAKATKARVEVVKTLAEVEKIKADVEKINAETIETLAGVDMASTDQALAIAEKLSPKIEAAPMGEGVDANG
jgi:hypothetical protein